MVVRLRPDARLSAADLARRWPGGRRGHLVVDGVAIPDDAPLGSVGLADGAVVAVGPGVPEPPGNRLVVVAGPLAPSAAVLGERLLIGSGAACDLRLEHPSVRPAHALIERRGVGWTACSLVPDRPSLLDGRAVHAPVALTPDAVLGVGAIDLQLVPAPTASGRPGARVRHRPPALPSPPLPPVPEPPAPPEEPPPPSPPGLLGLVLPVAAGVALAVLIHPTAGLVTAATPLLAMGAHLDARRRHRRTLRSAGADHDTALADHRRLTAEHELARAASARVDAPTAVDALRAARTGTGLWERRRPEGTAVPVTVGWADAGGRHPVTVGLSRGRALGLAGPRPWAEAVARAIVLQLAAREGPADLRVEGAATGRWRFSRWLPHRNGHGTVLALDGPHALIEVAESVDGLSRRCSAVLRGDGHGTHLSDAADPRHDVAVRAVLADPDLAEEAGRALARWVDPEQPGAGLPVAVSFQELAGTGGDGRARLATVIGVGADGPVVVDLVAHGPHALVAGTTGAGKSELLRTLVAGLAQGHPPTAVAFVLVDYKGGSAFDTCARLPHVTGVVTDLDEGLGRRLLIALRAEVRDREAWLRAAGVADLRDLDHGPPRLVVVVDEFATLAAELPEVLDALVDVARRGRSLGIHLVLATQRPAGAVSDDIRANTALRIALRTLDAADSQDVLGEPGAAALPADRPGRALVRLGGGPLVEVQVATTAPLQASPTPDLVLRGEDEPWPPTAASAPAAGDADEPVAAIAERWAAAPVPAPVWLPPLPSAVERHGLGRVEPGAVAVGLVDRPELRRQAPLAWRPAAGPFVVLGARGTGVTTAVTTAVTAAIHQRSPDALAVHVVTTDPAGLPWRALPHVGAVVDAGDRATVRRLLGRLAAEARPEGGVLLVVDGLARLRAGVDDLEGIRLLEALDAIAREGHRTGVALAVGAARPADLPPGLSAAADLVVVLDLADPTDLAVLGLGPPDGPSGPGRGRTLAGHVVQVALPDAGLATAPASGRPSAGPTVAAPLPDLVAWAELDPLPGIVLGRRDRDLRTAAMVLRPGTPFVVSGPPRSGRTTALALLVAQVDDRDRIVHRPGDDPTDLWAAVAAWRRDPHPVLVAIDDADLVDDPDGVLLDLVTRRHPDALLAVGLLGAAWRQAYGSWTTALRPATAGLALAPDPVRDAECWVVALPAGERGAPPPGRGVLVTEDGAELIQVAGDHP